jgi:hypothetical protein
MAADQQLADDRLKALIRKRERTAGKPTVEQILLILNYAVKKEDKRLYGDPRIGMDYQTLYEISGELSELMVTWLDAGCRLDHWPLRHRLEEDLSRRRLFLHAENEGLVAYDFSRPIREEVDLGFGDGYKNDPMPGRTEAVVLFFRFITGPFQRDVERCKRCRKFFWNTSGHSDKQYCTKRCAWRESATLVMQEKRVRERGDKLDRVRHAIKDFERLSPERRRRFRNWKAWVTKQLGLEVKSNFITRALNKGELKPPASLR